MKVLLDSQLRKTFSVCLNRLGTDQGARKISKMLGCLQEPRNLERNSAIAGVIFGENTQSLVDHICKRQL